MRYGAPLKNQNKGYAAQEKKDLLKDMPIDKVASGGSFLSRHMSTPLAMGGGKGSGMYMNDMAPKMEGDTPLEGNAFGKAMADNDGNYEAAKASLAPKMHGALHMDKGAPTKMYGGKKGDDSKSKKDYM
jgi:hypothetical protein